MSRTKKYNELCHPYREELKKKRKTTTKTFRKKEKTSLKRTGEPLVKPKDIWKDYNGKPNKVTKKIRTSSNFMDEFD